MSILRKAVDALRAAEEDWFGEEIAYVPLGGVRASVIAVPGKTVFRQQDDYGAYVRTETRDFIVRREHLAAEPQKGDEIAYGGKTYEVLAPNGEPAWRWSDPTHTADAIEAATKAFSTNSSIYFPGAKRLFLKKAVELARKFGGEANEVLSKALDDPELESRVRASMNSSTSSPESSESTPAPSPSAS